jgi:hypothetical protein
MTIINEKLLENLTKVVKRNVQVPSEAYMSGVRTTIVERLCPSDLQLLNDTDKEFTDLVYSADDLYAGISLGAAIAEAFKLGVKQTVEVAR